ncbi:MAG: S8 family peptidase [bacterium]
MPFYLPSSPWTLESIVDPFWPAPTAAAGRSAASVAFTPLPALPIGGPTGVDTGQLRMGPPAILASLNSYIPGQPSYVPGQILVTFRPGTPAAEMGRVYAVHQCQEIYTSPYAGFKLLAIPSFVPVLEMALQLSLEPSVLYCSPNFYRYAHLIPNDPYYTYQWHLPRLNCSFAWDFSTGIGAMVALLDSGVAYQTAGVYAKAPDLAGTLFAPGYDFVNLDAFPDDDYGHGTHMAGCIAQTTNNLLGVAGVAFNSTIMPVKVMDNLGSTAISAEADGIYFAANNGARIINMSLGGPGTSATEHAAVTYAYNAGVTIICSAGNAGSSVPEYPASYAECVSVSSIRYDYTRPLYSNYGIYVDVCSPGGDLSVDQNLDGFGDGILQQTFASPNYTTFYYYFMEGTSPAAALVSGVAALIISKSTLPLTPLQVVNTLETSATDLGTVGWDQYYGYGLVNAYLAVLRTI